MQENETNETKPAEAETNSKPRKKITYNDFTDYACDFTIADKRAAVEFAIQTLYLVRQSMRPEYDQGETSKAIIADEDGFKARIAQARVGLISLLYAIDNEDW